MFADENRQVVNPEFVSPRQMLFRLLTLIEQEKPEFKALAESDIVLFVTDRDSSYFEGGMYSGNQVE